MWKRLVFILILSLFVANDIYAKQIEKKHVAVVVVPSLSFDEVPLLVDNETTLWKDVAIGAMNVRPDGPYSYLNNIVSISIGEKSVGVEGWNSFERGETFFESDVADWMKQIGATEKSAIVHPDIHRLNEKNKTTFGRLGQLLHENGIERVVYGHSDAGEEKVRYAALLAMDENGGVNGHLRRAVKENKTAPFSIEIDIDFIISNVAKNRAPSQFTVVEWGDLHRLYKQRPYMEDDYFYRKREEALTRLHFFLTQLKEHVDQMWLLAPMMHADAYKEKKLLAPIFYWGEGSGYITSPTTRQPFLVSNVDFVPTIASSFGIPLEEGKWIGHPIIKQDEHVDWTTFLQQLDHIFFVYKNRAPVLSTYIIFLVITLISTAFIYFWKTNSRDVAKPVIRLLLLSALSSPLLFLLLANVKVNVGLFVVCLLLLSFLSGFLLEKMKSRAIFTIGLATFFFISLDLLLQTPLMQRSYLGYDPIIGARYYGIGNEFAGFYIISSFMFVYPFLQNRNKYVRLSSTIFIFLFLLLLLGKNTLGTNAGGTLSASIAFFYLLYKLTGIRFTRVQKGLVSVCAVCLGFVFLYVLQFQGESSHIGMAFERLLNGDFTYIFDLLKRKVEMNIKLFRYSNWTQLLVTSYILWAVIIWRKKQQFVQVEQQLFLQVGVITSLALLLFNDSGVVAAATSMFFVISTYYYWLLLGKGRVRDK